VAYSGDFTEDYKSHVLTLSPSALTSTMLIMYASFEQQAILMLLNYLLCNKINE